MIVIRKQDKMVTCECDGYCILRQGNKWLIKGHILSSGVGLTLLGKYRSKKRCLEILDEMDKAQEKQMAKCNTRVVDTNGYTIKNELSNHYFNIYYMPKK